MVHFEISCPFGPSRAFLVQFSFLEFIWVDPFIYPAQTSRYPRQQLFAKGVEGYGEGMSGERVVRDNDRHIASPFANQ